MNIPQEYRVVGVMSGTSLDGLDVAYCRFWMEDEKWKFEIPKATIFSYSPAWQARLEILPNSTAKNLAQIHHDYGSLIGQKVKAFLKTHQLTADFIASHGHTVFHVPDNNLTFQVGDGNAIAATCGLPVVYDFRSLDVALGGEGAPLAPVGDALLFGQYAACLNLGGIANISFDDPAKGRVAGDICGCNQVFNYLAQRLGQRFDPNGEISRSGKVYEPLLNDLNHLAFLSRHFPRSLGREWIEAEVLPLLVRAPVSVADQMCTFTHHVADQVARVLGQGKINEGALLITGGGAFHHFLIEEIAVRTRVEIVVPDDQLIQFRESLIFAFLGLLRWRKEHNVWASVTGATRDHCAGVIAYPMQVEG
ncbi:MAG: anhydro-N-acetylmuramic acid kinase [Bernardetiaceae bacterium]